MLETGLRSADLGSNKTKESKMSYVKSILVSAACACAVSAPAFAADDGATYLSNFTTELEHCYFPAPGAMRLPAVASFTLNRDGSTSDIVISKLPTSAKSIAKSTSSINAIRVAIRNAAPLKPTPYDLHCPMRMTVTFSNNGTFPMTCTLVKGDVGVASAPGTRAY